MRNFFYYVNFIFYMIGVNLKKNQFEKIKKKGTKQEIEEYLNKLVSEWSNFALKKAGVQLDVIGKENIPEGNCLFVANHQSNLDIPTILASVNRTMGFVAKKELEKYSIISFWMREINCVFIDRKNPREGLKAIIEGVKHLKGGSSMVIFPEGTRSKSHKIGDFKKGSMKMAVKAGVPIVPVTINGTYKALEGYDGKFKNTDVKVIIHNPIDPTKLNREEIGDLHSKVRNVIEKELNS